MCYAIAALFLILAVASIRRDRRQFRNAVLLGLSAACLVLALLMEMDRLPLPGAEVVSAAVLLLPFATVLVLAVFLVANGVTMLRRESRSLGNLLSLLTGLGMLALEVLLVTADHTQNTVAGAIGLTALALFSYLGFLFCCYLGYAFLYSLLPPRSGVDFVIVLGSRIIGGRVPPLLASRLDKAKSVYLAECAAGADPVIIASGGQGPGESEPEAHAMAEYLRAGGIPDSALLREDRSKTTEQNLEFSRRLMAERVPGYRCVIVTNNFHVLRTAIIAREAGVNGEVTGSRTSSYYWPSATIREFLAIFLRYRTVNLAITGLVAGVGLAFAFR
ncbi:predicted protein [Streptomyces sp. AA4]|nr:predicted protein [Streptomyces sp. AA4]